MEFETEPSSDGGGRNRRWVAALAAAMLVAAAGGVGFGLGYSLGNDRAAEPDEPAPASLDDESVGTDPTVDDVVVSTESPSSTAGPSPTEPPDVETSAAEPAEGVEPSIARELAPDFDVGPYSVDPLAAQPVIYSRTTESGLTVRVQRAESWPEPPADVSGWVPPGWCQPAGVLRVTLAGADVVDASATAWYRELHEGRAASVLVMGHADGAPHRIVVVQTASGTDTVAAEFDDGAGDSTAAVDGLAVLAVPGLGVADGENPWEYAAESPYELRLAGPAGEVAVSMYGFDQWADYEFRRSCQQPPPVLPAPGEQPADPTVAEDEIRAAMASLYGGGEIDNSLYLDDATGVSEAREQVRAGGFEAEAASAEATIEELVFTTPTEAWFRYRIETVGLDLDGRFGTAVLIDGTWRITRDTVCQDLSLAGGDCGSWAPITLPQR